MTLSTTGVNLYNTEKISNLLIYAQAGLYSTANTPFIRTKRIAQGSHQWERLDTHMGKYPWSLKLLQQLTYEGSRENMPMSKSYGPSFQNYYLN